MNKSDVQHILHFFTATHQKYPGEAGGVAWSERSQQRRFEVLIEGIRHRSPSESILDAACGYGDLIPHLTWQPPYHGIDVNPHLIELACQRYPVHRFTVMNLIDVKERADWVVASGSFNLVFPDNYAVLEEGIRSLWNVATKGLLFNVLAVGNHSVTDPQVFFYDIPRVFEFCRTLTPSVVCRTDYLPHDATFYLYKEQQN